MNEAVITPQRFAQSAQVAYINVAAGTVSNNETQWATTATSGTSGTVSVFENSQGRHFVSTSEPLILTREIDIGTGSPGSPDNVSFSMRKHK